MGTAPARVRLAGFGGAVPAHRATSGELAAVLARVWPHLGRRADSLAGQSAGIGRHLARPPAQLLTALPLSAQTARYRRSALALAAEAAELALVDAGVDATDVGLLVVASCTGFVLPGVDSLLVPRLGLRAAVTRMPFTLFGCGGGAAGLARACDWVRDQPDRVALVVAVELPSVTFRPDDASVDNLLSAMVFGDGAAAAVVAPGEGAGLRVGRAASVLVPRSGDALGFRLSDGGLQVVLSRRLPRLLGTTLPGVVADFLAERPPCSSEAAGGSGEAAAGGARPVRPRELGAVAVHPGGPAIITAVERCLDLGPEQTVASWDTLRRTGNTSSAALLFVLAALAGAPPAPHGRGLAVGFGPGLSIELLELSW